MMPGLLALQLHALGAEFGEHNVDALLLDRAQTVGRNAQRHPALLGLNPETLCMQVGQEAPTLLIVRVRGAISNCRPLAGELADAGHTNLKGIGRQLRAAPGSGFIHPSAAWDKRAHSRPCWEKE